MLGKRKIAEIDTINLRQLQHQPENTDFQKMVLTAIAMQADTKDIINLQEMFKQLDTNGDGSISLFELKASLRGNASGDKIYNMLKAADTDGSGEIDYTEFLAATIDPQIFMREDYLKTAFNMFDKDGSGKIDAQEIAVLLKSKNSNLKEENDPELLCQKAIQNVDKNGDG